MIREYEIEIMGGYELLVLSPEMITILTEKVKQSDDRDVVMQAEEVLSQGYAQFLACVLSANMENVQPSMNLREVYRVTAEQIKKLSINKQLCFEKVRFYEEQYDARFQYYLYLRSSEMFYVLVKRYAAKFSLQYW